MIVVAPLGGDRMDAPWLVGRLVDGEYFQHSLKRELLATL
jgi:hypothetical protein